AGLGAMTLTEQIDALEAQGLSPMRELTAPRVLACMLALPLLTLFIAFTALVAGWLAEAIGGTLTARQFFNECLRVLTVQGAVPDDVASAPAYVKGPAHRCANRGALWERAAGSIPAG